MMKNMMILSCCLAILFPVGVSGLSADENKDGEPEALLKLFMAEFVEIEPGQGKYPAEFVLGTDTGPDQERPSQKVKMEKSFAIAKYEVPQDLYRAVMGENPSRWTGERNSVEMISWQDANSFCVKLTRMLQQEKLLGANEEIRLPSELEWEYCCRAGTTTIYSFGDEAQGENDEGKIATILDPYAWQTGNAAGNDPPVGALKPNPWGLYDMHGYLWEFTSDDWSENYGATETDPTAISMRSGSWKDQYEKLTSSYREKFSKAGKDSAVGFRCVKAAVMKK